MNGNFWSCQVQLHQRSIEVAKSMDPSLLQGIRDLVESSIEKATSFDAFQTQVKALIASQEGTS